MSQESDTQYYTKLLKTYVRQFYDVQGLRIAFTNRASKDGFLSKDEDAIKDLGESYRELEANLMRGVKKILRKLPIYNQFLKEVHGIGPSLAGVIASEFDIFDAPAPQGYGLEHEGAYKGEDGVIYRMRTVSQFWAYAGLHTIKLDDGRIVAARHVKGKTSGYSTFLKTKLLKIAGDSFIKSKSPYSKFYYVRKEVREKQGWGNSPLHRHRDAIRFMVKCFVMDLFYAWREIEGLPVRAPYGIDKMNLSPSQIWLMEEHPGWKAEKETAV